MEKLTFNDFINYNKPCLCGNESIEINLICIDNPYKIYITTYKDYTDYILGFTYSNSLSLRIFHKNNKFFSNNPARLTEYLSKYRLVLHSSCFKCISKFETYPLDFNIDKGFLMPLKIMQEHIRIIDGKKCFELLSYDSDKKSVIYSYENAVMQIDSSKKEKNSKLTVPIIHRSKFKNKQNFIDKLSKLILFS